MNDTILRFLTMLRMLPRDPRKIDTATIERKLRDEGYAVTRRTIQRDLHQLARTFPLLCDEHRPAGWSWATDAALIDLPGMDPTTALTFTLVERFLAPLLPHSTFGRIQPYLTQAQRILDTLPANALGRWPSKVRVIHRGPPLRLPEIDAAILDAVTRGLLEGRRLEVAYRSREKGELLRCELNPLGLVFKGGSAYLVCTFWDYTDVRQVVLHRVQRAEVLEVPATVPEGFDLDRYIQEGEFSYPVGEPIRLEAVFSHGAAFHLHDTPLSADQVLTELDHERVLLRATVENTAELRWWLFGFGELVEVLAPADLRGEFRERAAALAARYRQRPRVPGDAPPEPTHAISNASGGVHRAWPGCLDRGTGHEGVSGDAHPTAAATTMLRRDVGSRRNRQSSFQGDGARAFADDCGSPTGMARNASSLSCRRREFMYVRMHRVFVPNEIRPASLLEALFMDRVLAQPAWHIRTARWSTDIPLEALTALVGPDRLVECGKKWYGWRERDQMILCLTVGYGEADAWVGAADLRALDQEMARLRALLPECPPEDTRQVAVRFWTWAGERTTSYRRRLDIYQWETIRDNYVGGTQAALDHVMREFRPDGSGQLLLWDGPPGTGKTSALRALIWQWRTWCAAEYIVDPEVLFGAQPSYLVSVLLHDHDEREFSDEGEEPKHPWRLLILEDSGEFLTMDAKERTGQALSRFLNVVDGLIGQGLRLLVLVTSNEALGKLHPAVSRPGRCVQKIRFQPFTTIEATAWLARYGETRPIGDASRTLAELYARLHGEEEGEQRQAVGFVQP